MKDLLRVAALLAAALPLAICAGAADRRETRAIGDFTAVGLSAPVNVHVTQGANSGIEIEGDAAALADIETVVENGTTLKIRLKPGIRSRWNHKVRVRVSAPRIDVLAIAGSGDISAPAISGDSLKISISGSGDVRVGGRVSGLTANISGSGDIRAGDLDAARVNVSIAGSGDAVVRAREALTVNVAGSGDVRYYGEPSITKSVLGSGSVRRAKGASS